MRAVVTGAMTLRVPPVGEAWQGGDLRLTQGGDRPPLRTTMPSEWQFHADGVDTAVRTAHDLDGTLTSVRLQLDGFKTREWSEEEADEADKDLHEDEEGVYVEYADGRHATLRYNVEDGVATLASIEPEDSDRVRPDHMELIKPAERILAQLNDIRKFHMGIETLRKAYVEAEQGGTHIDALDS